MTLIVTVASPSVVVQVSDRRITEAWPDGRVGVREDDENKALYVRCANGHFAVSYTGLARIGREPTHLWLSKELAHSGVLGHPVRVVMEYFERHVVEAVRKYSPRRAGRAFPTTAIVTAGYEHVVDRGKNKAAVFVAAHATGPHLWKHVTTSKQVHASIDGTIEAVPAELVRRVRDICAKRRIERRSYRAVASDLVEAIRAAAGTRPNGKFIGTNCTAVSFGPDGTWMGGSHYREKESPKAYPPSVIFDGTILRTLALEPNGKPVDHEITFTFSSGPPPTPDDPDKGE